MTENNKTWNLDNIYPASSEASLITELNSLTEQFVKLKSELTNELTSDRFMEIVKLDEDITVICSKLGARASLSLSENTSDSKKLSHIAKISELLADISNKTMFFNLWFKDLEDSVAKKFIDASGKYHYVFEQTRMFKPHTLSEKEEQIINIKDLTGDEALTKLFDTMTNSFTYDYKNKLMTVEEINKYKHSSVRDERKASYDLVFKKYGEEEHVLGEIYKSLVSDWRNENIKLRKFSSPINVRNKSNDIPDEAVSALLNVVKTNVGLFQEYFSIKSKILGLESFDRYDLYAPYSSKTREYSYQESKDLVLDTYEKFDTIAFSHAKSIFDNAHVHSHPSKGKRSGAFCYTVLKDLDPYILLNHTNELRDVFTMMHEFGHGIHGCLAREQTQFTFHSCLPLAETASIFGEMLLAQRLLKESKDAEEKKAVLMKLLDDQYASILRQAYFVRFEIDAHKAIEDGATIEELNAMYLANLREQFGSIEVPEIFQHEWKYIPHIFHTPFYCYAYTFGNLLVLSLYARYKKDPSFKDSILKILSYGGSESPENILSEVGIDITKEEFWQSGFDLIREELDELKELSD